MNKQTIILTDEKFNEIYTDEKFRNQVAFAHGRHDKHGKFIEKITCSYPVTYIVTEDQIKEADTERLRAKNEAVEKVASKLVFVGMGMTYELTELDDIGNHRIRTEFESPDGTKFFVEFGHNSRLGTNTQGNKFGRVDFAINRTLQNFYELRGNHNKHGEFYNWNGLERNPNQKGVLLYTKNSILNWVNSNFDCNFSDVVIDNYNLRTEEFTCKSPQLNNLGGAK